jgi:hypothetical protein
VSLQLAAALLCVGWAQTGGGRYGEVAVEEGRHDLDHAHRRIRLALEDGADRVCHEEVAVVGILELLDGKVSGLLCVEIARLVAVLDLAPHCLEGILHAHRQRKLAALENCEGVGAVRSMGILGGEGEHLDRQSHARTRRRHVSGHVAKMGEEGRRCRRMRMSWSTLVVVAMSPSLLPLVVAFESSRVGRTNFWPAITTHDRTLPRLPAWPSTPRGHPPEH